MLLDFSQWGQFKENQTFVSYLISYIEIFGTVTMMKDEPKKLYEASVRANNITTTGFELHRPLSLILSITHCISEYLIKLIGILAID